MPTSKEKLIKTMRYIVDGNSAHMCLYSGFERLRKEKDVVIKQTCTVAGPRDRKMKLIEVEKYFETPTRYQYLGNFWVDVVTGSLFHPETGKCLTSDQIWMVV